MTTIPLKGGKELEAFLSAFPKRLQANAVRAGLTAAARVVRDEARLRAPRESGLMAKAIRSGSPRINQDGTVSIRVRLAGPHSYVGTFLEYGVRPHLITAGDSKYNTRTLNKRASKGGGLTQLDNGMIKVSGYEYEKTVHTREGAEQRVMTIDKHFIGGAIMHPGFSPKPFLRPALEAMANEAINAMGVRIRGYMKDKASLTAPATLEVDDPEG